MRTRSTALPLVVVGGLFALGCGDAGNSSEESKKSDSAESSKPPASAVIRPVSEVVDDVADGVVYITAQDALEEDVATGSGFVIDESGLVATNYHVIQKATRDYIQFRDGSKHDVAGVVATDAMHDLAVLQIEDPPQELDVFDVRDPGPLRAGDELIAIGHPSGFKFTVTEGIVSAVRTTGELPENYRQFLRYDENATWVQTNAAISAGSSGGPLLNRLGQLVAVNTWVANGENLGFAIHVRHLEGLLANLSTDVSPLPLPGSGLIASPAVAAIVDEYERERDHLIRDVSRTLPWEQRLQQSLEKNPAPKCARNLLDLAKTSDDETTRFDALLGVCQVATDASTESMKSLSQAISLLSERHFDNRRMFDVAIATVGLSRFDEDVIELLRRLADSSPHHDVRGAACYALATAFIRQKRNEDRYNPEIVALLDRVADDYADVRMWGAPMGQQIEDIHHRYRHLSVGSVAPEIEGRDIDGNTLRLSDFRGKVTVVDFWADWCPYCREMYEHEREMVERYKDLPFALVGVNTDQRSTLKRLIANKTVTWPNWSDGPQGPISQEWQVESIPTVYILDHRGVIRSNSGEQFQSTVRKLLGELLLELPGDLIEAETEWRYLSDGSDQGTRWRQPDFDDSGWPKGAAPFGFGRGDERTRLDTPGLVTCYFRREFNVADPAAIEDLLLQVWHDDGIAVYVNGNEVGRTVLREGAAFDQTAAWHTSRNGMRPTHIGLDPAVLQKGRNVIAVEVHQADPRSADFRFDLSLSSNVLPLLKEKLADPESPECDYAVVVVGGLRERAREVVPQLQALVEAGNVSQQLDAMFALHDIDPEAASETTFSTKGGMAARQQRVMTGRFQRDLFWRIVRQDDFSHEDYSEIARRTAVIKQLAPSVERLPVVKALAEYRIGEYERALRSLRTGGLLRLFSSSDPLELACRAMCQKQLGQHEAASKSLKQARKKLEQPEWAFNLDARRLIREAERQIAATAETQGALHADTPPAPPLPRNAD